VPTTKEALQGACITLSNPGEFGADAAKFLNFIR
jgi:hypothetical protein